MIPLLDRIIGRIGAINRPLSLVGRNLAAALVAVMTLLVILQILLRATTGVSLAWAEELARVALVWSAFLVAPFAYRTGANVSIEMFIEALPRRLRLGLQLGAHVLIGWILIVFLGESLAFWQRGLAQTSATLPVSTAWFYAILPVAFVVLISCAGELILRHVAALIDPDRDGRVPEAVMIPTTE